MRQKEKNKKMILADIGGTHARFARFEDGHLSNPEKLPVADFQTLEDALVHFNPEDKATVCIATAAWLYQDGTWRFAREGRWIIDLSVLEDKGWPVAYIGNDFGASARGATVLTMDQLYEIRQSAANDRTQNRCAVLGSGTGLGLAYVQDNHVHETYGGHMDVPHRTDEQQMIVRLIKRLKDNDRVVSAEDIISGPGLLLLYKAVCLLHGKVADDIEPDDLLTHKEDHLCAHALTLYHEFLGLFSHQAAIYGHAYKALYLDGGVLHRLVERDAFDKQAFLNYFIGDPLPLIKEQLEEMSVHIVLDPFVALRGLVEIINDES